MKNYLNRQNIPEGLKAHQKGSKPFRMAQAPTRRALEA